MIYLQQNRFFAWIAGGLSIIVFLTYVLSSEKKPWISMWLSAFSLVSVSISIIALLKVNPLNISYHIFLPFLLIFYFKKEPIYFFSIISIAIYFLAYFMNDQLQIFPETYSIYGVYLISSLSLVVSLIILIIMTKLKNLVDFGFIEEKIAENEISAYLEHNELPYIFYLKAIADNIAVTSMEIRGTTDRNIENISKEKNRLQVALETAKVMQKSFYQTMDSISITRDIVMKTFDAARAGDKKISEIMKMVNKMMKFVDITKKSIYELAAATKKVEGVVHVIDKIASQTRLLSLNASIEGARFAGQQLGFHMVSKEVKELSSLTHLSVQDITNTMRDINKKTKAVQEIIYKEGREALEGLDVARLGEQSIKYVVRMMDSIQSETDQISDEMEKNRDLAVKITDNFMTIQSFLNENLGHMNNLSEISNEMKAQSDHLGKIIHARQITEMLSRQNDKVYSILTRFSMEFEEIFENSIRRGKILEDQLYSREYKSELVEGRKRFLSKYDSFFELSIQPLIDEYMQMNKDFLYFIVMDNEGYVPLENTQIKKITNSENAQDSEITIRAGDILQDHVSKQSIKSDSLYSLQCILTSIEPLMDMSIRLHYKDKYWGAVRAGFRYS